MNICRQCFREKSQDIGFYKVGDCTHDCELLMTARPNLRRCRTPCTTGNRTTGRPWVLARKPNKITDHAISPPVPLN